MLNYNFPDPGIARVNNKYYAFSTNGGKGNVQAATSTDMVRCISMPETSAIAQTVTSSASLVRLSLSSGLSDVKSAGALVPGQGRAPRAAELGCTRQDVGAPDDAGARR